MLSRKRDNSSSSSSRSYTRQILFACLVLVSLQTWQSFRKEGYYYKYYYTFRVSIEAGEFWQPTTTTAIGHSDVQRQFQEYKGEQNAVHQDEPATPEKSKLNNNKVSFQWERFIKEHNATLADTQRKIKLRNKFKFIKKVKIPDVFPDTNFTANSLKEYIHTHKDFPETKFTFHVNEVLSHIENIIGVDWDETNDNVTNYPGEELVARKDDDDEVMIYWPHKKCTKFSVRIVVDEPFTAPSRIECNNKNHKCRYFLHFFREPTRILPGNVSLGLNVADFHKRNTGSCIGNSSPNGLFSMTNFLDTRYWCKQQDAYTTQKGNYTIPKGYRFKRNIPWEKRSSIPVFRGHPRFKEPFRLRDNDWKNNLTACPELEVMGYRPYVTSISLQHPELLDASLSDDGHPCRALWNLTGGYINKHHYFSKYQSVLVLAGIGAAFRFTEHLAAGQAVILQDFKYVEWFTPYMTPNVHYIPLQKDLKNLTQVLEWVRDHPKEVREIAQNGKEFYHKWLNLEMIDQHWYELMWRLAALTNEKGAERTRKGSMRKIWPYPTVPQTFERIGDAKNALSEGSNHQKKFGSWFNNTDASVLEYAKADEANTKKKRRRRRRRSKLHE